MQDSVSRTGFGHHCPMMLFLLTKIILSGTSWLNHKRIANTYFACESKLYLHMCTAQTQFIEISSQVTSVTVKVAFLTCHPRMSLSRDDEWMCTQYRRSTNVTIGLTVGQSCRKREAQECPSRKATVVVLPPQTLH